ncbi:MAG: InlB B-repeat-containing protein [Bacteroidetes bacterium]|nr:InlB B-repeat-containing protein [Bacteroidota bacterium]
MYVRKLLSLLLLLLLIQIHSKTSAQLLVQPEHFLRAQQAGVQPDGQNSFIQVPIRMGGPGLGAVTGFHLFLSYDNQKLQFAGISPGAVSNVAAIPVNGMLSLQYSNVQAPINCTEPVVMFYLNFTRLAVGDVPLTFMHGSQVAGLNSLLPVNYQNGMVLQTWQLDLLSSPPQAGVLSGAGAYLPGQSASLSAIANPGYYFINWTRDAQVVSTLPEFDYPMPAENVTLTANFGLNSYVLQLQSNPTAGGSVSGAGTYTFGQTVQVQAVPNTGWAFTGWMLDGQLVSTDPNYTFTMPASNLLLWANFEQIAYPLQIAVHPEGSGTVSGAGNYFYNTQVTVQAEPLTGWEFTGWTANGQTVSTSQTYTFNMPASPLQLQANFQQILYPLQIVVNPSGAGQASGAGNYAYNTQVTVEAVPNPEYNFMSWNQGSTILSTDPVYTFSMPASALALTARFSLKTFVIEVAASSPEHGTVGGGGVYTYGQTVTVTAQANSGYQFVAWTEQGQTVSQEATYSFVALANRSLTAVFQQVMVCPEPLSLSILALGEQFAHLSWVSPASVQAWDLAWGLPGFNPNTEGTLIQGLNQPSYLLEGLNPQTTYEVYVRAWCENVYVSNWSAPLQFMTWYVGLGDNTLSVLRVFPNPASDKLQLMSPEISGQATVSVFSADGRLMFSRQLTSDNPVLYLKGLSPGIYHLQLQTGNKVSIARFTVVSN